MNGIIVHQHLQGENKWNNGRSLQRRDATQSHRPAAFCNRAKDLRTSQIT
jgi:hypothetical protein